MSLPNPPAYPVVRDNAAAIDPSEGILLFDYYYTEAMKGLLSGPDARDFYRGASWGTEIAIRASRIATGMMIVRELWIIANDAAAGTDPPAVVTIP